MSCSFWLRRKKNAAKKRERARLALASQTVNPTEEKVVEAETITKKPTRKKVSENDSGTDSEA